ncbi:MAG TPA: hypothetical protein VJP02_16660 [Candidatus Sulfotelmatobacter sp.]|nr:hypothetical protein [Candidatus Sulfotelmatobacter sp.]
MGRFWGILCLMSLLSCIGLAQVKSTVQWKCDKASDQHGIDVGDKPGHAYIVEQINCTAVSGDIDGAKRKSGTATEFLEFHGEMVTGHGEFIETMENGDKNFYTYQLKGTVKDNAMRGSDTYTLREGGGKLKGAKGGGTCDGKSNPDGTTTFDCSGTYTIAKK